MAGKHGESAAALFAVTEGPSCGGPGRGVSGVKWGVGRREVQWVRFRGGGKNVDS